MENDVIRHTNSNFSADQTPILGIHIQTLSLVKMFTHAYEKAFFSYSRLQ